MWMNVCGETCTGEGLVVFFAVLNWSLSTKMGTEGIWLVPVAEISNGLIKWAFRMPRPGWSDSSVALLATSHEYSFPSSHSMISFSMATYFSVVTGSLVPFLLAGLVGFSRVYEGMHYPHDVAIGASLGWSLGMGLLEVLNYVSEHNTMANTDTSEIVVAGAMMVVVTLIVIFGCFEKVRTHDVPAKWSENAGKSIGSVKLDPHSIPLLSYIGMAGVLMGLVVGEAMYTPFPMPASAFIGVVRVIVGLAILLGAFFSVRAAEKFVPQNVALGLRFFRFAQVPPIILIVGPYVFNMLSI